MRKKQIENKLENFKLLLDGIDGYVDMVSDRLKEVENAINNKRESEPVSLDTKVTISYGEFRYNHIIIRYLEEKNKIFKYKKIMDAFKELYNTRKTMSTNTFVIEYDKLRQLESDITHQKELESYYRKEENK